MKIEPSVFLDMAEKSKSLAFFDIEATGLRGDYNSILVASVKPYHGKVKTFHVKQPGNDKAVVRLVKEELEKYVVICGYFSKGFDIPMINTRLLKWGYEPVEKRLHIDMYFILKHRLLTGRKSQGHLLSWLNSPEEKMSVSADVWNAVLGNPTGAPMKTLIKRCESDVVGLQALYERTKHLIGEIRRDS